MVSLSWVVGSIIMPTVERGGMAADRYNVTEGNWQLLRQNFLQLSDRLNKSDTLNTQLQSQITALQEQIAQLQVLLGVKSA